MSRTDKDQPYWVTAFESGLLDHDHRAGVCRPETLQDHHRPRRNWRHRRHCRKWVTVSFACTKANPYQPDSWTRRDERRCWTATPHWVRDPDGAIISVGWRSTQCVGHTRNEFHDDIPCACDDFPDPPTCTPAAPYDRWYGIGPAPKWFRDAVHNNPERRRLRDELREVVKLANGGDDLEDVDIINRQHRNGANWYWW